MLLIYIFHRVQKNISYLIIFFRQFNSESRDIQTHFAWSTPRRRSGTPSLTTKIHFRHRPCLISVLVRFYLIFSLIGPPTMVAEAPGQHYGGLGRLEDGRNGLTDPNIVRLGGDLNKTNSSYCFGGLKEGLWSILC